MVGLSEVVRLGEHVEKGQPLARIHAARVADADVAERAIRAAIRMGAAPQGLPLVRERVA
jgi:thymidine phosphorylase